MGRYQEAIQEAHTGATNTPANASLIEKFFSVVLTAAAIIILVLGLAGIVYFVLLAILEAANTGERTVRTITLMIGLLAYFAAKNLGLSIPDLLLASLSQSTFLPYLVTAALIPAIAGAVISELFIRELRRGGNIAHRIMILITVLIISMFLDLFVYAVGGGLGSKLLPNVTFVLGVGLYLIFRYDSDRDPLRLPHFLDALLGRRPPAGPRLR
jgi:hypothetical protein